MLTVKPYDEPNSSADGQPAYTLESTGVQLLCGLVDSLTLRELESRAWTTNPHSSEITESLWGHLWIARLVDGPSINAARSELDLCPQCSSRGFSLSYCVACGFEAYSGE